MIQNEAWDKKLNPTQQQKIVQIARAKAEAEAKLANSKKNKKILGLNFRSNPPTC